MEVRQQQSMTENLFLVSDFTLTRLPLCFPPRCYPVSPVYHPMSASYTFLKSHNQNNEWKWRFTNSTTVMFREEEPKDKPRNIVHQTDDKEKDVPDFYTERAALDQKLTNARRQTNEYNMQQGESFMDKLSSPKQEGARRPTQKRDSLNIFSWEDNKSSAPSQAEKRNARLSNSFSQRNKSETDGTQQRTDEANKFADAKGGNFLNFGDSGNPHRFAAPTTQRRELNTEGNFFDSMSASESNSPNKGRRKIQPQAKPAESYEVEVDRQLKEEGVPHIARKRVSSQVFPQGTENHTEQTYTVEVGNGNQLSFRSQGEVEKPFTEYKEEPEEKSFNSNRRFHDHNKESAPEEPKPVRRASRPQQRSSLSFGSAGLGSYN